MRPESVPTRPSDLHSVPELRALLGLSGRDIKAIAEQGGLARHRFVGERAYSLAEFCAALEVAAREDARSQEAG